MSLLTANNPLGVVPAGILFGGLDAGGQYIGFTLDVPPELVNGVVGLVVLFVATLVLIIRYEADQIVAGLAVWFVGLSFGPFTATVIWGGVSSPSLPNIDNVTVPVLAQVPVVGPILFDVSPLVLFTVLLAIAAWVVLYRTKYGYWVQAAGGNPEALDTAGVDVNRVRYAAVVFSGALAGLGGAVLAIGIGKWVHRDRRDDGGRPRLDSHCGVPLWQLQPAGRVRRVAVVRCGRHVGRPVPDGRHLASGEHRRSVLLRRGASRAEPGRLHACPGGGRRTVRDRGVSRPLRAVPE
nr:hypothetical protein [Halorussus pelagicus]